VKEDDLNYLALLADANPCATELVAIVVVELTDLIEMAVIAAAAAAAAAVVVVVVAAAAAAAVVAADS